MSTIDARNGVDCSGGNLVQKWVLNLGAIVCLIGSLVAVLQYYEDLQKLFGGSIFFLLILVYVVLYFLFEFIVHRVSSSDKM